MPNLPIGFNPAQTDSTAPDFITPITTLPDTSWVLVPKTDPNSAGKTVYEKISVANLKSDLRTYSRTVIKTKTAYAVPNNSFIEVSGLTEDWTDFDELEIYTNLGGGTDFYSPFKVPVSVFAAFTETVATNNQWSQNTNKERFVFPGLSELGGKVIFALTSTTDRRKIAVAFDTTGNTAIANGVDIIIYGIKY